MTIHKTIDLKNNGEYEVVYFDDETITIKNNRLEAVITHQQFKYFYIACCITTHVSQGSTYDFPYSIYEYQYFEQCLFYTAMSRSTQKSYFYLLIINHKYQLVIFIKIIK